MVEYGEWLLTNVLKDAALGASIAVQTYGELSSKSAKVGSSLNVIIFMTSVLHIVIQRRLGVK